MGIKNILALCVLHSVLRPFKLVRDSDNIKRNTDNSGIKWLSNSKYPIPHRYALASTPTQTSYHTRAAGIFRPPLH